MGVLSKAMPGQETGGWSLEGHTRARDVWEKATSGQETRGCSLKGTSRQEICRSPLKTMPEPEIHWERPRQGRRCAGVLSNATPGPEMHRERPH